MSHEFVRIIKISILWANYLIPSIYLQGHIRIIEIEKVSKTRNGRIEFPDSLARFILKPTIDEIKSNICEFLTATEICNRIKTDDYNYSPREVGQYLHRRGFKLKSRRIKNVGVRKVYEVCINNNAS